MNKPNIPPKDPQKIDEEITAYLDGELTGEDLRNIEKRLASDSVFRSRLHDLDRGWTLLNELPQHEVSQNFAATTVEMVALQEQHPDNGKYGDSAGQVIQQWVFVGFAVLAACLGGFILSTSLAALLSACGLLTNNNDAVLKNLPVLQNLDKYQLAENIEFLQAIDDIDYFSNASTNTSNPALPYLETIADRKSHIDRMLPTEKKRLLNAQEQFMSLTSQEQMNLRDLHQQLASNPNANDLNLALEQYYEWYKQLDPREHVELRIRSGEDRISYIRTLLTRPQTGKKLFLTDRDLEIVLDWLRRIAMRNRAGLLRSANQKEQREIQQLSGPERQRLLITLLWKQWRKDGVLKEPTFDEQNYIAIKEQLSAAAREQLDKRSSLDEEVHFLLNGVRSAAMVGATQKGRGSLPDPATQRGPSPDQLKDYFKSLPEKKRAQMKRLSREEYYRELLRGYYRQQMEFRDLRLKDRRKPSPGPTGETNRTRRDSKNRRSINNGPPKQR